MIDLLLARAELLNLAQPSVDYCRGQGIDWIATAPACGGLFMAPIRLTPGRRFEFDPDGILAAVCEAIGEDATSILDLVAWSTTKPHRFRTAFGAAPALGMAAACNPATYFGDRPLRLFRTPLAWLQAACDGAVLLDPERGARWLLDIPTSKLAAEDDDHAAEIVRLRQALLDEQSIVVPVVARSREAA